MNLEKELTNKILTCIYMHIYDDKTRWGGLWIWCSECYSFSHSSLYIPEYWENCALIELEKLSAIPIYLNKIKDKIDNHMNMIENMNTKKWKIITGKVV